MNNKRRPLRSIWHQNLLSSLVHMDRTSSVEDMQPANFSFALSKPEGDVSVRPASRLKLSGLPLRTRHPYLPTSPFLQACILPHLNELSRLEQEMGAKII
jgi:hypothetical protein